MLSLLAIQEEYRFCNYFDIETNFILFNMQEKIIIIDKKIYCIAILSISLNIVCIFKLYYSIY